MKRPVLVTGRFVLRHDNMIFKKAATNETLRLLSVLANDVLKNTISVPFGRKLHQG